MGRTRPVEPHTVMRRPLSGPLHSPKRHWNRTVALQTICLSDPRRFEMKMGRQPQTETPSTTAHTVSEGSLNPSAWASLVLARANRSDTGTVTVNRGTILRTFRFIRGCPVSATSTDPAEDFTETLVSSGDLEPARLTWIRKHTNGDESEVEALIGAGTISRDTVNHHHAVHVQHLIAATLAWPDGGFSWTPMPEIEERFERTLLPTICPIEGLICGVMGGFDIGALCTFVDAADAGDYLPDPRMTGGSSPEWVPKDLKGIHSVLGQSLSRSDIATQLGCDPDRLAALLWLLTATGWAHRAHPPAALVPLGSVATIQAGTPSAAPTTHPAPEVAPPKPPPQARSTAPKKAVVPTKAPSRPAKENPVVQAEAFSPRPPVPAPKRVQAPLNPASGLAQAKAAINEGDFDTAYATLTKIRKELPSCPDTLAALGWSAWRTGNLGTNAYDGPEDYLLLALTFDGEHPLALEYYARIAIDKSEIESARNRLLQVLRTTPDSVWAKEALEEITPKSGNKGGIRLWPKGRS